MQKSTLQSTDIEYFYLFDAKVDKKCYFALKEKYGYSLSPEERTQLQADITQKIKNHAEYDTVVIPQSRGTFLLEIAKMLAPNVVVAQKESVANLKNKLEDQAFMKSEKIKLFTVMDNMEQFAIHDIAGNQRKRFTHILFQDIDYEFKPEERVLLLDDSVFSGYTLQALQAQLNAKLGVGKYDSVVLFSQQA